MKMEAKKKIPGEREFYYWYIFNIAKGLKSKSFRLFDFALEFCIARETNGGWRVAMAPIDSTLGAKKMEWQKGNRVVTELYVDWSSWA